MESRYIRIKDAAKYLGMNKNRFNEEVRPTLIAIPIGRKGIAFDRLDLDRWADDYKLRNGRPGKQVEKWQKNESQVLLKGVTYGTSTSKSVGGGFVKALEKARSTKLKNS